MNEKEPLLGELPEGALTPQEAGDQEKEGLSPRHQRVAALLTRLAATARSFLLYDPQNEAIQRFLALLLDGFVSTLAEEGALTLTVLPMELVFEGHSVYLNRDRERSLAFRLHRDGVRELRFRPGFDWEELARLLEILSIRYTGIHQHEDDIVTLLWKAAFRHLDFVAVEGIVPDDDEPGAAAAAPAPALPGCGPSPTLPDDVDLPRPSLPPPVGPSWGDLPSDALDRLRSEASPSHLPADCLALLAAIRLCIGEASLGMRFGEVAHVFGEIRDFLLGESHLAPLKGFVALLWKMAGDVEPAWDEGRHAALYELLESCGDRRALRRLLRGIPPDSLKLDPELVEVLDRACPD
ncbi:MAG TPA: hypothetical protein VIC87_15820, partial [Vicinamibacteria bacterium]